MTELPVDQEPTIEEQQMFEAIRERAEAQAAAELKKNGKEIDRLKKLAEGAVLENNFESYKYAIEKLRTFYHMQNNDTLTLELWKSTRKQIWEIIQAGQYQDQVEVK
ncbi:hypothetical protein [Cronobacter phage vB_Cdu_VP8]|nr:hypothetical protein [Cronobacter phage vB_Cdu_VP8]